MKPKLTKVIAMKEYHLLLSYDDGVEGKVDLGEFVAHGVFDKWTDPKHFNKAHLGNFGEVIWDEDIDMCGDSLYMRLTGKTMEQTFQKKLAIV